MPDATPPKPVVLIVRDGWGHNPHPEHDKFNAIKLAKTPRCDTLRKRYPHTLIHTCCRHVGLPPGTMGNSEVGHQNLGAGRVVYQESVRVSVAVEDGSFFDNHALADAVENASRHGHKVHLMGIASDAGVHGLLEHLYACAELCKRRNVDPDNVCVHLFTDGRDTGPFQGKGFAEAIEAKLKEIGVGRIVSVVGRYYAMDRDNRWERVKRAYDLLTGRVGSSTSRGGSGVGGGTPRAGDGPARYATAAEAIQHYYDHPTNDSQTGDEFVPPSTVGDDPAATRVGDGDTVIFYNYRGDRPRELVRAFMQPDFHGHVPPSPDTGEKGFDRGPKLNIRFVCMTAYDEAFYNFHGLAVAFPKPGKLDDILGQIVADHGKTQLRCAETEKFPHVTFFADDYRKDPFPGETWEMAQSPQVATYDLEPEMSAHAIRDIVLKHVRGEGDASGGCPDLVFVNFANGDMVGHTGKLDATVKAVETVDACVGDIVDAVLERGGKLIVTADHGNAEQMFDPATGSPHTAHTTYDVECIVVDPSLDASMPLRAGGKLADVAPTLLELMHLDKPDAMTGQSLLHA